MPALPELVIEKSDGSTRDTLDLISASKVESLIEMWVGYAVVDRSAWLDVKPNVSERTDTFKINRNDGTTFWAGRYAEDSRDGDTVTLTIESFERDARDYEPTDGKVIEENVADDYVARTHGIDPVDTLSQGTIETGDSNVSFSFAYAERAKVIRDAAEPAGMDVAYRNDQTVDFLNRLGSDKSGTITVSTTSQDIVEQLSVEDNYRDPVTHIRGLGAQQGNSQVTATATISSYSAGERQVWRLYENKDIIQQDRLQSIVDRLASDFDSEERRITVEAKLVDVDIELGDSVTVDLPEDDINRSLRITRTVDHIDPQAGTDVTLTNRDPSRGGDRKRRDDLKRFNSGDQGFVDRDNFRAVERQPVDSTYNAQGNYFYPDDVLREDRAEIFVQALPYRAYISGAGHSHDVTVTHPSHSHTVTHPDHDHDLTSSASTHTHALSFLVETSEDIGTSTGHYHEIDYSGKSKETDYASGSTTSSALGTNETSTTELGTDETNTSETVVGFDPGLNEYTNETASGVDLLINGTEVATNIGTGEFTTTVDVAGEFTPGNNTIELTSDSLGFISSVVRTELFRSGAP